MAAVASLCPTLHVALQAEIGEVSCRARHGSTDQDLEIVNSSKEARRNA